MATEAQCAYFAGIIDGEGCIYAGMRVLATGSTGLYVRLTVTNTDSRLLYWLRERFGGHVMARKQRNPRRKETWDWTVAGEEFAPTVKLALRYLVLKREQAELALQLDATLTRHPGRYRRVDAQTQQKRVELVARLHDLNRRGVAA